MLEGAVARLLNQLLGKYVVDLDTENLNVGIFSGQVQLTDLKLKPEALYELNLPVEVKSGTIGKIWLQIPWVSLWSQPIILNIEDVHIVFGPVVTNEPFDEEKNKRLTRAAKRRVLEEINKKREFFSGPAEFTEHLITNLLNYLQLNITNIHIRYEDEESYKTPIGAGLCIGSITADTTNSKWKPTKYDTNSDTCYYLLKVEALSFYWNSNSKLKKWELPSQYYQWRNAMSNSFQNYSYNNEDFDFVLNPMAIKMKIVTNKTPKSKVNKIQVDVVIHDCSVRISKEQYDSMLCVADSMKRMLITWTFLPNRPNKRISENRKMWWKYASYCVLEQRVKPYTWSRIRRVRENYRRYMETYKQILLNPNDTELKLDLQKYEDDLSVINIVIARQHARLLVVDNINETNYWLMLPSQERTVICEKIGYSDVDQSAQKIIIEHNYSFRLGHFSFTLAHNSKEILVLTLTQTIVSLEPKYLDRTFKASLKVEGLIVEGVGSEENLLPIISSEHLKDSPAYFLKIDIEKLKSTKCSYKLGIIMDSVEYIHNKLSLDELTDFLFRPEYRSNIVIQHLAKVPAQIFNFAKEKLLQKWELTVNIKIPHIIIPNVDSYFRASNLLVVDLGRYSITTQLCQQTSIEENATPMELDEQLYSKLILKCSDVQVLFCDIKENWKDARKEKDTELHIISKTAFQSIFAVSIMNMTKLPRYKFNVTFPVLKFNVSERKIGKLIQFWDNSSLPNPKVVTAKLDLFSKDRIQDKYSVQKLRETRNKIGVINNFCKYRRHKIENGKIRRLNKEKSLSHPHRYDMNEAYARCVDLPGLEDNISPNNNINILLGIVITETIVTFCRSSDNTDKQYLILRLGIFTMDVALMTFGPAYQISLKSILLTDKLHTSSSGQYLDLIHTPMPSKEDVLVILFRRVSAGCADFWTHFHGVETSLVANLGSLNVLLHQDAVRTVLQYSKYLSNKFKTQIATSLKNQMAWLYQKLNNILHKQSDVPVPSGSVKFSHSARLKDMNIRVCDSDFDIVNIELSGFEVDVLFRANERFVLRTFLANINVEHLSEITLYPKILYTDEDKVFELKYVRNTANIGCSNDISPNLETVFVDGVFKFELGKLNIIFLYKLIVQLERFISNLDALQLLEPLLRNTHNLISTIRKSLKPSNKIHLTVNICGPVILIPQKSSSPNVIAIDTGNLKVENFFKDCSTEVLENILLKLTGITITRGVMTLTTSLEGQEVLIDPISLNMDIKRNSVLKTSQSTWDIDCIIDLIQITLGQRDLTIIMSIFTENIGEGKIMDLLPNKPDRQSDNTELDDSVKNLEAFFCEPKLKQVVAKYNIEEIKVMLFFDSGELLSSPIRDLNHGLCKLEILEIDSSITIYSDGSLDGKLSVDKIVMEEIGPNANASDKFILQSPTDDTRNNNCNITVNKPPIVDITFHQNKMNDKTADVIIGRLILSFSIPFCERLALFVIECLPKQNVDRGIINPAYEAEPAHHILQLKKSSSLTLSIRINKPELIFLIETTSNRKRYFVTKTEILIDYSLHLLRKNLVMSLSGLHCLFFDLEEYAEHPYTILRQCDIELCESISEDSGEKITLSISAIHLKLCTEVVHSINDILNDIVEHFKLPTPEVITKGEQEDTLKESIQDLWKPEKLNEYVDKMNNLDIKPILVKYRQILLIPKFQTVVIFELELVQILIVKATVELTLYDWLSVLNCTCEISLQANYFNEFVQQWEPLIDPIDIDEKKYKPWEIIIKVFQDKSQPMLSYNENKMKSKINFKKRTSRSVTTTEDEDSGEDMMYLEPTMSLNHGGNRRVKTSLSTFLDDSDSENEDGTMEKLAAAISDLFTGDWNENEDSEYAHSSEGEDDEMEENDTKQTNYNYHHTFYILVDAKETLNFTLTPNSLRVLNELITQYSNKIISVRMNKRQISLVNDIGPHTKIELFEVQTENPEEHRRICLKKFENDDSLPNSPTKSGFSLPDYLDTNFDDKDSFDEETRIELEAIHDFETISNLMFLGESTSHLYNRINKQFLKIHIPNYPPIQTTCSIRNWEKLINVHSMKATQAYFLAAKHTINKLERTITVSSPLKIKNETCFALSVLYQPSVLQQMNLEPVGEVTNPFETTMRIAVLEAHEEYSVPLYIAYHCKLFIQPAYAEGHYASDCGIWWKDLATDLDSAQDLQCKPKSDSNVEIFSLKVLLRRNLETTNNTILSVPNYVIHLMPPLIITNFLPYLLEILNVSLKQVIKVEPGEQHSVYSSDFSKDQKLTVRVKHSSTTWTGNLNLTKHLDEKSMLLNSDNTEVTHLTVNVKVDREGSCNLFFFAPYWIMNKTGLPLQIKASAATGHDNINEELLLFSYKRHGKQTVNIRVYESNWSNEVSLECAGTTGLVVCKNNERKKKYLIFLHTRLSNMCPRLTKVVTILPGFLITNNTDKFLRFMEYNEKTDLWIDIAPFQTMVFWPETNSMELCVKFKESKTSSHSFFIASQHKTVLRMDKGAALTVDIKGGVNESFRVTFNEYKYGDAPVLVKNYCADLFLKIQQRDQSQVTLLNPYHSLLYTWDDPVRPRQLIWNVYNNKGPGFFVDITKDGCGEERIRIHSVTPKTSKVESSSSDDSDSSDSFQQNFSKKIQRNKILIYWISYRDGLQRTLLLTQDLRIYKSVLRTFHEWCNVELLVALSGVGMSIFTSERDRREHLYAIISDTPAIWEVSVGRKWKTLTLELASWIEDKYRLHYKKCQLREYIHIDFEKMFMIKPFFAELRRTYYPAVYIHLRKSRNYMYYNIRLQSVQVDNKHSMSIILQPSPTPNMKEVSPFIELLILKTTFNDSHVYKCIKIKVGNAHLNIENYLFVKLCKLFEGTSKMYDTSLSYFDDIKSIHKSITTNTKQNMLSSVGVVIEHLTLTSFGIQLNISNQACMLLGGKRHLIGKFLDYLFPINMSPYMPIEGVHHKISSVEHLDLSESLNEALANLCNQVTSQFLQQYYSHVLGIQVLVNTFAIQPAIEVGEFDFEETGNILLRSSRCLLGHINMSPAAVEACVTDIFVNQNIENIQRMRRHGSFHKSEVMPKTITISSRNFATGVPNALRQLIVKNHGGMSYDGEMFFRTTGKALLSLITRHPDEKSDSVEVAREALRRASILGEPIRVHQRLNRYRNKYLGLTPLSLYESMGYHLLETIANSRFTNDIYWAHAAIDKVGKSIVIVSLEHIIRINKCRLWGPWEVEWAIDLDDVVSMPKIDGIELILHLKQNEANVGQLCQLKITGQKEILLWLHEKIEQAIIVSTEEKSWPVPDTQ